MTWLCPISRQGLSLCMALDTQARMVDLTAPPSNNEYDPKDQRGTYGLSEDGAYVYPDARGAGGDAGEA
jgi:hypothetical protein